MAEADMVARYYQDASAAVTDLRTMIDTFEDLFTFEGDLEDDSPEEPYRYCVVKGCGNLAGGALAESIRQFVRAVQRVEEYVSTDRSARVDLKLHEEFSKRAFASLYRLARVDLKLLEEWACEIAFTFSNAKSSEKLVDLFIRVRQAFWTFADEVECDSRVAINSSPKKPKNPRKPKLNSLMVNLLQKHGWKTCVSWSVESWAIQLVPQWGSKRLKSSIVKTETWKWISGLRKQAETDLTDHQTADDESGATTMPSAATLALRNEVESGPDAVDVRNTMQRLTKGSQIEYRNAARDADDQSEQQAGAAVETETAVGMPAIESGEAINPAKPPKYASKETPIPNEYKDINGKPIGPLQGNETELSMAISQNRKAKPSYLQSRHLKRHFIHTIGHQDFHVYFIKQAELDRALLELEKVRAKEPPYGVTPLPATPNDSK